MCKIDSVCRCLSAWACVPPHTHSNTHTYIMHPQVCFMLKLMNSVCVCVCVLLSVNEKGIGLKSTIYDDVIRTIHLKIEIFHSAWYQNLNVYVILASVQLWMCLMTASWFLVFNLSLFWSLIFYHITLVMFSSHWVMEKW